MDDLRFGGIGRLYGVDGLQRLGQAHVAVVGIGGVGSWAAEALVRSGVGEISLFDLDDVCITNINRQAHALSGTVGQAKVEVMAQRLLAINPACTVHAIADFVSKETLAQYITQELDYVVDCIDGVQTKAALIAWCKRRKIQIITTGGAGGQIDPTQIGVVDLNKTFHDPLASRVRTLLRSDMVFHALPVVTTVCPVCFLLSSHDIPTPTAASVTVKVLLVKGSSWIVPAALVLL